MRKIAANIIYPVTSAPVKDAYIVVDDDGTILDLVKYNRHEKEIAGLEYYSGILVPGFINAHCHLELSHLKGQIKKGLGLKRFIKQVQSKRKASLQTVEIAIQKTLKYMWSRGVSGLGDVVNSSIGINIKRESPILIHNFIELFNESQKSVEEVMQNGVKLSDSYQQFDMEHSMAPHSMYGTNHDLLNNIVQQNSKSTSLHFLESRWESMLDPELILAYLNKLNSNDRILLVHNLHLNKLLFKQIKDEMELYNKLFWVLCPNSNLYIKNQIPIINDFNKRGAQICLGTDSLASNSKLSILDEMKTVTAQFSEIPFEQILKWATLNGAKALGMESSLGSFEKGKQPGVLLISDFNFEQYQLTPNSEVTRLV